MGKFSSEHHGGLPTIRQGAASVISRERLAEAEAALRMRFLVLAPRRVSAFREALRLAASDDGARRDLQRQGHQLHGTAATVGLVDLGLLGGFIERTAAVLPFTEAELARIATAVELIEEFAKKAIDNHAVEGIEEDPRFRALQPGGR